MSDDHKYNDDEKPAKKGGEFRVPPRTWIVWIAIFGGIIALMLFREKWESPGEAISQYKFQQLVESNQITQATINYSPQNPFLNEIVGKYDRIENDRRVSVPFRTKARLTQKLEEKLLALPQFDPREPNTMLLSVVWSVLP